MNWMITNSSLMTIQGRPKRMPVWFMPVALGVGLLVGVVVALVMCIRWRQLRSSVNACQEEGEEGYEEISRKTSPRNKRRNTDKDDYEIIPVILRKTPKECNKNSHGEYKALSSVRPQHELEYASLNKATCSSKTSLSSLTSGRDVREDRSKKRTNRQGLIIPSLSNPIEETAERVFQSSDDIATMSTKQVERVNTGLKIANPGANQQKSSNVTRSVGMRPKPVTTAKPCLNQREVKKNELELQYENATVFIDGNKSETRRLALGKHHSHCTKPNK